MYDRTLFNPPKTPGSLGNMEYEEVLCPIHCMAMALMGIILTFSPRALLRAWARFAFKRQRLHYQEYTRTAVRPGLIHTIHRVLL
jgi:hypothetical protein